MGDENMTNLKFSYLKFLLMPRYITIRDISILLENINLSALKELRFSPDIKLQDAIVYRALNLVEVKDMEYIIKESRVRFWNRAYQTIICKMLDQESLKKYVPFVLIEWLSMVFMILSIYFRDQFKSIGGARFKSPFVISKGVLLAFIDSLLDENFLNTLKMHNLKEIFDAFLWSYGLTYKYLSEIAKEEERDSVKDVLDRILKLLDSIDFNLILNNSYAKIILSSLIFMPLNVALKYKIKRKGEFPLDIVRMLKLIEDTYSEAESFLDLVQRVHIGISKALNYAISGQIEEGIKILRELGKAIFDEKMNINLFGVTERVLLKVPVEASALELPPIHVLINLADELSEVGLILVSNEIQKAIINTFFETRLLLQSLFILHPTKVKTLIEKALEDEWASITLLTVFGSVSSRLLETLGLFIEDSKILLESEKFLEIVINLLNSMFERTKALIRDDFPISIKRIIIFPLYREAFYTGARVTPQIRSALEKIPKGKEFLKLLDDIFSFIESITKPKVEKKREEPKDIADLYI